MNSCNFKAVDFLQTYHNATVPKIKMTDFDEKLKLPTKNDNKLQNCKNMQAKIRNFVQNQRKNLNTHIGTSKNQKDNSNHKVAVPNFRRKTSRKAFRHSNMVMIKLGQREAPPIFQKKITPTKSDLQNTKIKNQLLTEEILKTINPTHVVNKQKILDNFAYNNNINKTEKDTATNLLNMPNIDDFPNDDDVLQKNLGVHFLAEHSIPQNEKKSTSKNVNKTKFANSIVKTVAKNDVARNELKEQNMENSALRSEEKSLLMLENKKIRYARKSSLEETGTKNTENVSKRRKTIDFLPNNQNTEAKTLPNFTVYQNIMYHKTETQDKNTNIRITEKHPVQKMAPLCALQRVPPTEKIIIETQKIQVPQLIHSSQIINQEKQNFHQNLRQYQTPKVVLPPQEFKYLNSNPLQSKITQIPREQFIFHHNTETIKIVPNFAQNFNAQTPLLQNVRPPELRPQMGTQMGHSYPQAYHNHKNHGNNQNMQAERPILCRNPFYQNQDNYNEMGYQKAPHRNHFSVPNIPYHHSNLPVNKMNEKYIQNYQNFLHKEPNFEKRHLGPLNAPPAKKCNDKYFNNPYDVKSRLNSDQSLRNSPIDLRKKMEHNAEVLNISDAFQSGHKVLPKVYSKTIVQKNDTTCSCITSETNANQIKKPSHMIQDILSSSTELMEKQVEILELQKNRTCVIKRNTSVSPRINDQNIQKMNQLIVTIENSFLNQQEKQKTGRTIDKKQNKITQNIKNGKQNVFICKQGSVLVQSVQNTIKNPKEPLIRSPKQVCLTLDQDTVKNTDDYQKMHLKHVFSLNTTKDPKDNLIKCPKLVALEENTRKNIEIDQKMQQKLFFLQGDQNFAKNAEDDLLKRSKQVSLQANICKNIINDQKVQPNLNFLQRDQNTAKKHEDDLLNGSKQFHLQENTRKNIENDQKMQPNLVFLHREQNNAKNPEDDLLNGSKQFHLQENTRKNIIKDQKVQPNLVFSPRDQNNAKNPEDNLLKRSKQVSLQANTRKIIENDQKMQQKLNFLPRDQNNEKNPEDDLLKGSKQVYYQENLSKNIQKHFKTQPKFLFSQETQNNVKNPEENPLIHPKPVQQQNITSNFANRITYAYPVYKKHGDISDITENTILASLNQNNLMELNFSNGTVPYHHFVTKIRNRSHSESSNDLYSDISGARRSSVDTLSTTGSIEHLGDLALDGVDVCNSFKDKNVTLTSVPHFGGLRKGTSTHTSSSSLASDDAIFYPNLVRAPGLQKSPSWAPKTGLPRGKLFFSRTNSVFIRYFDNTQIRLFLHNIETAPDMFFNENGIRNIGTSELIQIPRHINFSRRESLSPTEYVHEIEMVHQILPIDFREYYQYITRYQICHSNNPVSLQTFLTMHNTNRLTGLLKSYVNYLESKKIDQM